MKTIRRLLYRDIVASVAFVALAFLALFFFIDLVDELDGVGRGGRNAWHALAAAGLELPGHLYDLFPIAVLIGTIYSLARLAQSSEFTILRTGGLGPGRALSLLAFFTYYNLINLSQAWVAGGRMSMGVALVVLHGGTIGVALALLWWRDHSAVTRLTLRRPRAVPA